MLTDEARQALRLAAQGLTTPELAEAMGLPPEQARAVLAGAIVALGARSKLEAIISAMRAGLLET